MHFIQKIPVKKYSSGDIQIYYVEQHCINALASI